MTYATLTGHNDPNKQLNNQQTKQLNNQHPYRNEEVNDIEEIKRKTPSNSPSKRPSPQPSPSMGREEIVNADEMLRGIVPISPRAQRVYLPYNFPITPKITIHPPPRGGVRGGLPL